MAKLQCESRRFRCARTWSAGGLTPFDRLSKARNRTPGLRVKTAHLVTQPEHPIGPRGYHHIGKRPLNLENPLPLDSQVVGPCVRFLHQVIQSQLHLRISLRKLVKSDVADGY